MNLSARLAYNQLIVNRRRTVWTLIGIILSSAMLTAVCGFVSSAKKTVYNALGMDANAPLHFVLIMLGAILGTIVMTASIIVVSNAFRVSAGERTRQFGILKSVGATKKQIAASVLYEGIFLSVIGIPIGIAVGLFIDFVGVSVITNLFHSLSQDGIMNVDSEAMLTVPFSAPPIMFVIAVLSSFGTVLVSAWLPARKAAKIPAMDAIRNTGEIKLKSKNVRASKLIQVFFGFEGTLASKSLKRSRRSFRATVLSLTISIVLLITAGSFGTLMRRSTEIIFEYTDADVLVEWSSDTIRTYDDNGNITTTEHILMDRDTVESITDSLQAYNGAEVSGYGGYFGYETEYPADNIILAALLTMDKMEYEKLCGIANVPVGSAILINLKRETNEGKRREFVPYDFSHIKDKTLTFTIPGHESIDIVISGQLTGHDVPDIIDPRFNRMVVIVPECDIETYSWYVKTDDIINFESYAENILDEKAPKGNEYISIYAEILDISMIMKQISNMNNTIMFFVYGFVGMLALIAVTSVISTINTNVRSRAKEFAVLESVGMTESGIKKMLNLESILCSARSLIFGIPLGLLVAYAMYYVMEFSVQFPFEFPLLIIIECILGVFAVTWITMRYSASKLRDKNIIETIRSESGI